MRRSLLLAFAVLLLGTVVLLQPWRWSSNLPEPDQWPDVSVKNVSRIDITNSNGAYSLVSDDDHWMVQSALAAPRLASTERVSRLLRFVSNNKPIRRIWDGPDIEKRFPVIASVSIDTRLRLELGKRDDTGKGVYARRKSDWGAFVLASEYSSVLGRPFHYYVDMRLSSFSPEDVSSVTSKGEGGANWTINRNADGFAFAAPEVMTFAHVLQEDFGLWLHLVATLKASALAIEKPSGDPSRVLVFDTRAGKERLELYAPAKAGERWCVKTTRQEGYFMLDPSLVDKLNRNAFSLVERRVISFEAARFQRLSIAGDERRFSAIRTKNGWVHENGSTFVTGIDMFLWRLTDLQYEYGPVGALPATASEQMRLFLENEDGARLGVVFYEDTELPSGRVWAAVHGIQAYYPVDGSLYRDLQGLLTAPNEPSQE